VLELLGGGGGPGPANPSESLAEQERGIIARLEPFDDARSNAAFAVLALRSLVLLLGAVELPRAVRATLLWYKGGRLRGRSRRTREVAGWLVSVLTGLGALWPLVARLAYSGIRRAATFRTFLIRMRCGARH
jgi:hypothetical protein